jgi:predicted lipid-binding transport protein (Tim44 family)
VLLASFALTGVSFLSYAAIAARRGEETNAHGKKSFFYSTGLAEGAETIAVFVLMCMAPAFFGVIALFYAGLCALTVVQRSMMARRAFRRDAR